VSGRAPASSSSCRDGVSTRRLPGRLELASVGKSRKVSRGTVVGVTWRGTVVGVTAGMPGGGASATA